MRDDRVSGISSVVQLIRARMDDTSPGIWVMGENTVWNTSSEVPVASDVPYSGDVTFMVHSRDDIRWLAIGYAMTVDILWSGYEATQGKRMPASERAELLQLWGVSEEDIAWAKQQKDDPRAAA